MDNKRYRLRAPADGVVLTAFTGACLKFFGWSALVMGAGSALIGVLAFAKNGRVLHLFDVMFFCAIGVTILYFSKRHSGAKARGVPADDC